MRDCAVNVRSFLAPAKSTPKDVCNALTQHLVDKIDPEDWDSALQSGGRYGRMAQLPEDAAFDKVQGKARDGRFFSLSEAIESLFAESS